GGLWAGFRLIELQRQLDSAIAQLGSAGRQRADLQQQLEQNRSLVEALNQRIQDLKSTSSRGAGPETLVAEVSLSPGVVRSATSEFKKVPLTGNSGNIRFSLLLLDSNYSSYTVVLQDDGGHPLWTSPVLKAKDSSEGKVVVATTPITSIHEGVN